MHCDQCGGEDFYKESGFYYCNECQTQTQEIEERVADIEETQISRKSTRKAPKIKSKSHNKITSWECYNFVMLGLTRELIDLGADHSIKQVVRMLWLMYLEKLQVFQRGTENPPKLQAVNNKLDAEIIYGRPAKRKKRASSVKSSSLESDSTNLNSVSSKSARIKRKKKLIESDYSHQVQSIETVSLRTETLSSLKTDSTKPNKSAISYNIFASRELRKNLSKSHLNRHIKDVDNVLDCHNVSYKKISRGHQDGPFILSPNKLYAILYLAILINGEAIQLGDLLRFMNEGTLSLNKYDHFFPDDFDDKILSFKNQTKKGMFSNKGLRRLTARMATFLNVTKFIQMPNLVDLTRRYCDELNLPRHLSDCVLNVISRAKIKLIFQKQHGLIPNYEGRVLSVIMFVLKLLFGLDGSTELELSKISIFLQKFTSVKNVFDVINWLKYLEYRKLIIANHHFPAIFDNDKSFTNYGYYLDFMLEKRDFNQSNEKFNQAKFNYDQILSKLVRNKRNPNMDYGIDSWRTPFCFLTDRFLDRLNDGNVDNYLESVLSSDFKQCNIDFILNQTQFVDFLSKNPNLARIQNGGACDVWIKENLLSQVQEDCQKLKEKRKAVTVKLLLDDNIEKSIGENKIVGDLNYKKNFMTLNRRKFELNSKKLSKIEENSIEFKDFNLDSIDFHDCLTFYRPFESYWMMHKVWIERSSREDSLNLIGKFPYNFRLVFEECARIARQTEIDLLSELQRTEVYFCYVCDFEMGKLAKKTIKDNILNSFIKRAIKHW